MDIKTALLALDKTNDEQWTADGSPRLDAVAALVGATVKRQEVIEAYPGFSRTTEPEENGTTQPEANTPPATGSDDQNGDAPAEAEVAPKQTADDEHDDASEVVDLTPAEKVELIRTMTLRELSADPELLAEAIAIVDIYAAETQAAMNEAKVTMERAARLASQLREIKARATKDENPNLEYIKSQNEVRAARARRAQEFVAAGTTPREVIKALSTRSPLDTAMAGRKAALGSQRPKRSPMG